jgi:mannose-1-phosphate guanylyltransferase
MKVEQADSQPEDRAAVILAGGEGSRLRSLTRRIAGHDVPKQFCAVVGEQTLLEQTLDRAALGIEPRRTLVALTRHHERFYGPLLAGLAERNLVVQPRNRGTAPAILYSLLRLLELAPQATVAIFPSDHFVSDDREFMRQVGIAFEIACSRPDLTVVLGIEPQSPEKGYGWIEPALPVPDSSAFMVRRFWEKPSAELAGELFGRGCLWNSFVVVGRLSALLGLFVIALPSLYVSFRKVQPILDTAFEREAVERVYADLDDAGFSEGVLANRTVNLAVLPVHGVAWSDLGEPHRVMETFAHMGVRPRWAVA